MRRLCQVVNGGQVTAVVLTAVVSVTSRCVMVQHGAAVLQQPPRSLGYSRQRDGPQQRHPPGKAGYVHTSGHAG